MIPSPKQILDAFSELRLSRWKLFHTFYTTAHDFRPLQFWITLLCSVGLGILTSFSLSRDRRCFKLSRDKDEAPKILINTSRGQALARSAIHLLPALVSIGLMVINIRGFFIGIELQGVGPEHQDSLKLGLLQVAAKTQVRLTVSPKSLCNCI